MGNRLVARLNANAVPSTPAESAKPVAQRSVDEQHHLGAPAAQSEVTVVDDLGNFKRMDSRKVRLTRTAEERAARIAAVITGSGTV